MASLERGEKIFGPSKPCISTKRPREQQQQEKEAKKANNASSEKKKSVKWKDQENDVTKEKEKGGGKNVDAVRKEQQEEKEAASKPSYKLEDTEKAAPNNEKEKKNARLRKTKEKRSGSEEKRKEKRKKMVDSDCDSNPKETSDIAALKLRGGHLQNRFLSEADSKVESVDVIPNRSYEDKLDHSKIMPFGIDRVGEPVKLQHQKEIKRGEKDKSVREAMFEKVVTPSDVGKVNRLVIPKHHAEKYFPLDTNANDKGSLLNFEDNTGKAWRFRYSYGSQRYMLTKGWSRFVKEKKLDAGDIVSFQRATDAQNAERLFISWKRRPCALQIQPVVCCEGGTSKGEMIKQFNKERTNVMNNFKNEVIDEYRKKLNQLEECIINVVREAKHGSSNNRECDDFWFSSNEMIQRLSSFKSKELPPLSSSEMEEFEHKCREREAIVLEANIKCLALMQEELQLMKAKIRAPVSGGS